MSFVRKLGRLLDKISEEFRQRKQADWETEDSRIESRIAGPVETQDKKQLLNIGRILELAHNAHSL